MSIRIIILFISLTSSSLLGFSQNKIWENPVADFPNIPEGAIYHLQSESPERRALDLIKHLTFDEVIALSGGFEKFYFPGISRLGIRPAFMADASQGLRTENGFLEEDISTSFPGTLALAASWNNDLAFEMGKAVGSECRAYGVDILLGPGVNLQRFSVSGRNYEYMGEDPYLTGRTASAYINGLQSNKVLATAKHFVGNDQEFCRHIGNSIIDEQTLRELYLKPWEMILQRTDLKAIMTGNNLVNGTPNSLDRVLTQYILRDEFGFDGMIMTDWQNSRYYPTLQYLFPESGVSLHMPENTASSQYIYHYLKQFAERKNDLRAQMERKIYHNLLPLFEMGVYDRAGRDPKYMAEMKSHKQLAQKIAEEGICLLKNDQAILPLSPKKKVLLIGESEIHSGKGSGFVEGYDHVSFEDGLKKIYGKRLEVSVEPTDEQIARADAIVYLINKEAGEGKDVPFEEGANHEISKIAQLNENVVVVISSCNGLPMPWINDVKGVIWAFFLGQERGDALANVISGQVNPSGKLPFTLEKDFMDSQDPKFNYLNDSAYWYGDNRFYKSYWLNYEEKGANEHFMSAIRPHQTIPVPYKEGRLMGYRWYDSQNIEPHFPFGFGLSYTDFEISCNSTQPLNLNGADSVAIEVKVENIGKRAGAEVVQLYLNKGQEVGQWRQLIKYKKVRLKPSEQQQITFYLSSEDIKSWKTDIADWVNESGSYQVSVGSSSRNLSQIIVLDYKQ